MKCPNAQCAAENPDSATFCKSCGTSLAAVNASAPDDGLPADRQCPACGRAVPGQARFCGKCGCPIAPGPAEDVPVSIEPQQPATPPAIAASDKEGYLDAVTEPSPAFAGRAEAVASPAVEDGGVGKPAFLVAVIAAAVLFGGLVAWLYLSGSAPAPAPSAQTPPPSVPAPAAVAVIEPPPATEPAPALPPPAGTAAAPPAQAPTGQPFLSLQGPDREAATASTPISDAAREEEARAKAERARRRAEAKAAREALALQQARDDAARAPEPAPTPPAGPKEACAGESSFIARNSCEARICQLREWMYHPYCMQRRQHEEQKRGGTFGSE